MNIQAEKLSIIQQLLMIQDERLITAVKNLLEYAISYPSNITERYDDLPASVRESIEAAIQELDAGHGIPHHTVMAEIKAQFLQ